MHPINKAIHKHLIEEVVDTTAVETTLSKGSKTKDSTVPVAEVGAGISITGNGQHLVPNKVVHRPRIFHLDM